MSTTHNTQGLNMNSSYTFFGKVANGKLQGCAPEDAQLITYLKVGLNIVHIGPHSFEINLSPMGMIRFGDLN